MSRIDNYLRVTTGEAFNLPNFSHLPMMPLAQDLSDVIIQTGELQQLLLTILQLDQHQIHVDLGE